MENYFLTYYLASRRKCESHHYQILTFFLVVLIFISIFNIIAIVSVSFSIIILFIITPTPFLLPPLSFFLPSFLLPPSPPHSLSFAFLCILLHFLCLTLSSFIFLPFQLLICLSIFSPCLSYRTFFCREKHSRSLGYRNVV